MLRPSRLGWIAPLFSALAIACGDSATTSASTGSGGNTSSGGAGTQSTGNPSTGNQSTGTSPDTTGSTGDVSPDTSSSGSTTGSSGTGGAGGAGPDGQWVMGYYVGYAINDYPIADIDWTSLTHIIFSPMVVKNDLSLDLTFDDTNGTGPADAKLLSKTAHDHGVKALLMLGGANAGANIKTAASDSHRAAFVTALTSAMDQLGYDGVDLDWEDSFDIDEMISLAQDLRAARPGIVLSYPAGSINSNYQTVDPKNKTLAESLDRFNVQTYYPSSAFSGQGWDSWFMAPISGVTSATPIAIDDTLNRYAEVGIPKSKLGLGIGFYAICYTGGITAPHQPTTSGDIVGGDNDYPLSTFFAKGSTFDKSTAAEQKIDATAQEPYLSLTSAVNDPGCKASTRYISYEDETSIAAKGTFSKTQGYGGVIIWQLAEGWLPANASGGRAQNAIMQAVKKAFLDP